MRNSIKYLLFFALIAGIGFYIYRTWDVKAFKSISFNWGYVAGACMLLVVHFLWVAFLSYLLMIPEKKMAFMPYLRIYFISQMGRYIPGKVWMVLGKMELLKKEGYSRKWIAGATVLEMLLMIVGAAIVIAASLLYFQDTLFEKYRWVIYAIGTFGLIGISGLKFFLNLGSRILLKQTDAANAGTGYQLPYKRRFLYFITLGYSASWVLQGAGFFYLIKSFYPVYHFPYYAVMIYAASWIIGFLTLFAPSGLGAKEGIMILFLGKFSTASEAAVIAAISRVWSTGIEILIAIVFGATLFNLSYLGKSNKKLLTPKDHQ